MNVLLVTPVRSGACRATAVAVGAVLVAALAGCADSARPDERAAAVTTGSSASRPAAEPSAPTDDATAAPSAAPSTAPSTPAAGSPGPSGRPSAVPSAPVPGQLPVGPAAPPTPPPPAAPGSLGTVDWTGAAAQTCPGGRPGRVAYGDLDADGRDEAAVEVVCGPRRGATRVLVHTGDAADVRLVGDALPPDERSSLHAVEVRDGHLVVTGVQGRADDPDGPAETAVTSRWVVGGGALTRTDRYEDPAYVLDVDEHG